jgi:beta-lactamase regulating signal transducer with metallopeptidase domain
MDFNFIATAVLRATALLALGLLAIRWLPASQPQWRRAVALFCLAASLVLPFVSLPATAPGLMLPVSHASSGGFSVSASGNFLALFWALGIVVCSIRLARRVIALRRWIGECETVDISRPHLPLRVIASPGLSAPCVAGFMKPVLIVPAGAREWNVETWRCVLAHEMQHCRQGDLLLGWISHLALILYWWHPFAGWLERELGQECETCCDHAVLQQGVNAADYVRELLRFSTDGHAALPVALSMSGKQSSSLRLRIERMLGAPKAQMRRWRIFVIMAVILIGVTGTVWLGFTRPAVSITSDQRSEAELRLSANPFPADAR